MVFVIVYTYYYMMVRLQLVAVADLPTKRLVHLHSKLLKTGQLFMLIVNSITG